MGDKKNYTTDEILEILDQYFDEYFKEATPSDLMYREILGLKNSAESIKFALETLRNYE